MNKTLTLEEVNTKFIEKGYSDFEIKEWNSKELIQFEVSEFIDDLIESGSLHTINLKNKSPKYFLSNLLFQIRVFYTIEEVNEFYEFSINN